MGDPDYGTNRLWAARLSRRHLLIQLLLLSHQKKIGKDKPRCKPAKELGNGSAADTETRSSDELCKRSQ